MSEEDRYTLVEFARRYKLAEARLPAFCELMGVSQDTVLTREEFRAMLARFEDRSVVEAPPEENQEPQREAKEEAVANKEEEKPFAQWVKGKIRHARVFKAAFLKSITGWNDDTRITEAEFDKAFRKHLLNKE